jgi:hypothetical protein
MNGRSHSEIKEIDRNQHSSVCLSKEVDYWEVSTRAYVATACNRYGSHRLLEP